MFKRLTKHGNSLAVVIDRPILDLLKIDSDTPLEVSTDGTQLIITPVTASRRREIFEQAEESVIKRYGNTLRKLAE
jgi:antitoxin component of MazEF toxin-antitoxin module